MYAVVVVFQIKEGALDVFLPEVTRNAQTSVMQEPGCHRFDVCTDPGNPREVLLYELYTDRTAFGAHLSSAHFAAFDTQVAPMIEDKEVRIYAQVIS